MSEDNIVSNDNMWDLQLEALLQFLAKESPLL